MFIHGMVCITIINMRNVNNVGVGDDDEKVDSTEHCSFFLLHSQWLCHLSQFHNSWMKLYLLC